MLAWRELVGRSAGQWRSSVAVAAEVLGVPHDEALQEAVDAAEACAAGDRPAPFAAAHVFGLARRALTAKAGRQLVGRQGRGGRAARGWLADAVLAQRLKWPFALPLLAAPLFSGAGGRAGERRRRRRRGSHRVRLRQGGGEGRSTCRRSSGGGRKSCWRPQPKLRAKGAGAALQALLDDNSLSASSKIGGQLSERGARRLFDRLVALGAIRELTGRATFRLYGL